jgi:hypothetical protein
VVATEKIALLLALLFFIAFLSERSLRNIHGQPMSDKTAAAGWSELDISGLRMSFRDNMSVSDIADYLLRTKEEVKEKARELGIRLNVT